MQCSQPRLVLPAAYAFELPSATRAASTCTCAAFLDARARAIYSSVRDRMRRPLPRNEGWIGLGDEGGMFGRGMLYWMGVLFWFDKWFMFNAWLLIVSRESVKEGIQSLDVSPTSGWQSPVWCDGTGWQTPSWLQVTPLKHRSRLVICRRT